MEEDRQRIPDRSRRTRRTRTENFESQAQGFELDAVGDLGAPEEFYTDKRHRARPEWESAWLTV